MGLESRSVGGVHTSHLIMKARIFPYILHSNLPLPSWKKSSWATKSKPWFVMLIARDVHFLWAEVSGQFMGYLACRLLDMPC